MSGTGIDGNDDNLIFKEEDAPALIQVDKYGWKVLIVDDDDEIHNVTRIALSDVNYNGEKIQLLHAFSGKHAKDLIEQNPDISIILLDIVMEEDDSGLKLINYIRNILKNNFVRIVIRTGQPGQAPERKVIIDYDINDYREKTELTSQKLFSTIISSLRSYNNIMTIEKNRKSLVKLLEMSNKMFLYRKIEEFTGDIFHIIFDILAVMKTNINRDMNCFLAINNDYDFILFNGTGIYNNKKGSRLFDIIDPKLADLINNFSDKSPNLIIGDDFIMHYFKTMTDYSYLLYLDYQGILNEDQLYLIKLVFNTISSAYENICLNNDIVNTQSELLITLGEVIEKRSNETGNHVRRVAEYSKLLALKYGLGEEIAELIKQACPMHDIGKVGVLDEILNKPGKYTPEEYSKMKQHTTLGYQIFKDSNKLIFKAASIIALEHHEKYDGSGYPQGLKGEKIHIYGRITSLADVFDALSSNRSYKKAWEMNRIFEYIKEERGKSFDPDLVDLFFDNISEILQIKNRFVELQEN